MSMRRICLFFLLLISTGGSLGAQELQIAEVNAPQKTPFAQPFTVQYRFSGVTQDPITVDEASFSPDFEITESQFSRPQAQTAVYDFTVLPFTLGVSTFTVTFQTEQDGKEISVPAEPLEIDITPVKVFNDTKWREIRSPRVPASWGWLILLLLLIGGIAWARRWWQARQNRALEIALEEDLRPCDEIALSKIKALLDSGLWEKRAYKIFYITLGEILREYLWRKFQVDASADTTAELLHRVKTIGPMQPLLVPLRDFLNSGDLVKFAKAEPEEAVRNQDVAILREIVRETSSPKPEESEPEKPL